MPKLVQYTSQGQIGGAIARPAGGVASVDVTPVVQGLSALDAARRDLSRQQDIAAEQLAQDEARLASTNAMSEAAMTWQERLQKAQAETKDASGFTSGVLKEFDAWQREKLATLPERARKQTELGFANFKQGLHAEAFRFEVKARNDKLLADSEKGLDADSRALLMAPESLSDTLARRLATVDTLNLPAPVKEKLAAQAREKLSWFAGQTLAEKDPQAWLTRDARTDPIASLMDPKQLDSLNDHARAIIKQREARDMAGRDAAVKAATKKLDDLREFTLSGGVVSPQYEEELRATLNMPGLAEAAAGLIKMSRDGAGFAMQPPEARKRVLDTFQPGDPKQLEIKQHMQRVDERLKTAYKEDPWGAATAYGRMPEMPARQITSAQDLRAILNERWPAMERVQAMAGGPVSFLRPAEVLAAQTVLSALPVEQRAAEVGRYGSMLSVPQIGALAEQLGKGDEVLSLMLKAGTDRAAGSGVALAARIGKGAQLLKDKVIKAEDEKVSGWRAEISKMIRGTMPHAEGEETEAINAAFYVRAAMEQEGYQYKSSNEAAVRLVVGSPYERQGMKTLLPKTMDESQFTAHLEKAYTAERLSGMAPTFYVGGKEVKPAVIANRLSEMGMQRNSRGQYVPFHNGAAVTLDKEGTKPLFLEVR